jgi:hypothetical protein
MAMKKKVPAPKIFDADLAHDENAEAVRDATREVINRLHGLTFDQVTTVIDNVELAIAEQLGTK